MGPNELLKLLDRDGRHRRPGDILNTLFRHTLDDVYASLRASGIV